MKELFRTGVPRKLVSAGVFLAVFAAFLAAIHRPYLALPFHWDELGQFVPAALDLYHDGDWVAHSTLPNVHPPAVMALVALAWRAFGYSTVEHSILVGRLAMLAMASLGTLFSFLLAIRLARGTAGAPAFAAVLFLLASPWFYTQSRMVQLDMPAMTLTVLALLLFLDGRWGWCAAACTLLALTKETAITTPLVFGAWLWLRDRRRREALYFLAPILALAIWLIVLHRATGHWLGNEAFAQYNVSDALKPLQILYSVLERAMYLFLEEGRFIGVIALYVGWRLLRGRDWSIAALVAGAQLAMVTLLGGAVLDRYLLPVLPILYAAFAVAASAYPAAWRWTSHTVLIAILLLNWVWNPPYPFQYEDNLAMVDFVELQRSAAEFLELNAPTRRIASMWPFTGAIGNPEFGYVERPLQAVSLQNFDAADLAAARLANLNRRSFDLLVVYSRQYPIEGSWIDVAPLDRLLRKLPGYHPQATQDDLNRSGYLSLARWERHGQWIEVYVPLR
jgi:4-amino-4-deoxy-L-arabinose transferase-like glycosyltransferase